MRGKSTGCGLDPEAVRDLVAATLQSLGTFHHDDAQQADRARNALPVLGALHDLGAQRPLIPADLEWATAELQRRAAR